MSTSPIQAISTTSFLNTIGVNTHLDFSWTSYANTQLVENEINYLGVHNLRDSANNPNDVGANGLWQQVANATGAKFDAFIGEGSPASMQTGLTMIQSLASQHILSYIEGGNEEDDAYPTSQGNSLAITAQFQQQVDAVGHQLGLPVINMSFGNGWATSSTGDYGTVGNLAAYADYANAHTYFGTGNPPASTINMVNSDTQLAAAGRPVITTEMGWYTTGNTQDVNNVSETVQAKYMLDGLLDAYKAGDVKTYLYELMDQQGSSSTNSEDHFGLFRADGSAKPAAIALHDLTTLLADNGSNSATFTPGALNYSLTGLQSTDNSLLMEKSDGTYWLAIWDEARLSGPTSSTDISVPNHNVTLTLGSNATAINIYDPLTGTTATQTLSNVQSAQISLPDHPVLVQIVTPQSTPSPILTSPPPVSVTPASTPAPTPAPTPVTPALSSNDLVVNTPASESTTIGATMAVASSITDSWAQQNTGTMALNLTVGTGTLTMNDASGHAVTGSGTNAIHLTGTLAQLNADLATLNYHAANLDGSDQLSVDVWNQAGVEVTKLTNISVASVSSSNDLSITVPKSIMLAAGSTSPAPGVTINDSWAQHHPGAMALNLSVTNGTLNMVDATGHAVAGSGTNAIHLTGTVDQLNAELASLNYHANSAGAATLSVEAWNQAGISSTQTIALSALNLTANSTVTGTAGNDIISGVAGSTLRGGAGADTFMFTSTNTGVGNTADHVADFSQAAGDKIDLHGFGLSAANFVGTGNFSGSESISYNANLFDANGHPYTLIKIDSNGDHVSDHEIRLDGVHVALSASDFAFA